MEHAYSKLVCGSRLTKRSRHVILSTSVDIVSPKRTTSLLCHCHCTAKVNLQHRKGHSNCGGRMILWLCRRNLHRSQKSYVLESVWKDQDDLPPSTFYPSQFFALYSYQCGGNGSRFLGSSCLVSMCCFIMKFGNCLFHAIFFFMGYRCAMV